MQGSDTDQSRPDRRKIIAANQAKTKNDRVDPSGPATECEHIIIIYYCIRY
jgi:hypothetical protein